MARLNSAAMLVVLCACTAQPAWSMDHVVFELNGTNRKSSGRVLVEAQDGGLLFEGQDGVVSAVQPNQIVSRQSDDQAFAYLAADRLANQMLKELPEGFRTHKTAHYVICYNTSKAYAQWCGALFERLRRAFYNYWRTRGFQLQPSPALPALIFRDQASYERYSRRELGEATNAVIGFYSLTTNRITTYDLTGVEEYRRPGDRRGTSKHINQMLSRPEAERTVATVIHEATHQLAFNSGLQTRFADIPVWLSEGLAIYFESPDLRSQKGWRRIGAVNRVRLSQFRDYLARRPPDSLTSLLVTDDRFRDTRQADDAYAEAWILAYYLIRNHPDPFVAYLKTLGQKQPLATDNPEQRLKEFRAAFGDLEGLDANLLRSARQIR